MNAKRCKALRRRAHEETIGKREVMYVVAPSWQTRTLSPFCTRGVYQRLKREARLERQTAVR